MNIIYEDNHLLVINKPNGMLVQGDRTGDPSLESELKKWIKTRDKKPGNVYLGVVHRLDRPVSGVVVFSKTSKALARLNKQFQDRTVVKEYFAIVEERPKELSATLIHHLTKNKETNTAKASNRPSRNSKEAELRYDFVATGNHRTLLKVVPKTGRPHQIRVQLAKIGCSIDGDLKYGSRKGRDDMIHLHAASLTIQHPTTKEPMTFKALPPDRFNWSFFKEYMD